MSDKDSYRQRLLEGLRMTVHEVMSTMAWSDVTEEAVTQSGTFTMQNGVTGLIRLYGPHNGMVGISCQRELAGELVSRITGLPVGELFTEDILDGVAELANMICGGMKTKAQVGDVELSPPVSIVGSDYQAQWKTDRPTLVLNFRLEEQVFQVYTSI